MECSGALERLEVRESDSPGGAIVVSPPKEMEFNQERSRSKYSQSSVGPSHWLNDHDSINPDYTVCRIQPPLLQNMAEKEGEWTGNSKQNHQLQTNVHSFTQNA